MKKQHYLLLMVFLALIGCAEPKIPEASLSVEAYLYAGKPIDQIRLSLIKPIEEELVQQVSDAEVYIIWNNKHYELIQSLEDGRFYYPDTNLKVIENDTYNLYIRYHEQEYYAETIIPKKPLLLTATKDTIDLAVETDEIGVTWQNNDSTWYLGVIAPEIDSETELPFNNFFSLPTQESVIKITTNTIYNTGNQHFVLYGITEEYAKLYRISSSSIGATNVGNLSNGFGIFAGFSSDTLTFVAKAP